MSLKLADIDCLSQLSEETLPFVHREDNCAVVFMPEGKNKKK